MTIPDYQSLMLPVLSAASSGEIRIGDLVDRLAEQLKLTPEQRAELLPSGRQTVFSNRVHWAKTYLSKAGLLQSTRRGHFQITPRGQQVLASRPTASTTSSSTNSRRSSNSKERRFIAVRPTSSYCRRRKHPRLKGIRPMRLCGRRIRRSRLLLLRS